MQSSEPKSDSHSFSPMTSRAVRPHNRSVGTDRLEQIGWNRSVGTDRLEQIASNRSLRTDRLEQIGENRDGPEREKQKKQPEKQPRHTPAFLSTARRVHEIVNLFLFLS
jgi:hypothetical protein